MNLNAIKNDQVLIDMNSIDSNGSSLKENKNFKLLALSSVLSLFGDQLTLLTLPWLVLLLTQDPLVLGSVIGTLGLPMSILILFGGVLVDRYSAKNILLFSKLVSSIVVGLIAFLVFLEMLTLPLLYLFVFILGTCTAFMLPAATSLLPRILKQEQLQSGNAALMFLRSFASLVGPLLAAYILGADNEGSSDTEMISLAFAINAASYIVSSILISGVLGVKSNKKESNVLKELLAAFKYVRDQKQLKMVLFYTALAGVFVSGPLQVASPLLVKEQLGGGGGYFGLIISFGALGGMIGMMMASKYPRIGKLTLGATLLLVDSIVGLTLAAFSLVHDIYIAISLMLFLQIFIGYMQVAMMTWIQCQVSEEMLGRVMSIVMFAVVGILPLSASIAGYTLTFFPTDVLFRISGFSLFSIAVLALLFTQIREIRLPVVYQTAGKT